MKTEKIVISFIAVAVGILVAGVAFYFYQASKTVPISQTKKVTGVKATPTPKPTIFLSVDKPVNEEVVDQRTVTIAGKTSADATIIVSSQTDDQVVSPAANGSFSVTTTIQTGANQIQIIAIAPNGDSTKVTKTITFSTESF